jgi:hypothetical protein
MPGAGVLARGNSGIPLTTAQQLYNACDAFGREFLNGGVSGLALQ